MRNRLAAAALLCLAAAPGLAQDRTALDPLLAGFASTAPQDQLAAAYAACLAGDGNTEATDALFTAAGWARSAETEMGIIEFTSPDSAAYAMIWDVDGYCLVLHESIGTDGARRVLDGVISAAGYDTKPLTEPDFCPMQELRPGLRAELTSSGNDPVCDDAATSGVRFEWSAEG